MSKTNLEKSHSTWSNTKLTVMAILLALMVTVFWVSLGLLPSIKHYTIIPLIISSGGILLLLFMFKNFKR